MIALPLFFLSNAILAIGTSLTGCALTDDPSLTETPVHLEQTGAIVFSSPDDIASYKVRFSYHQLGENSYVMSLHPFLMSPIRISMSENGELHLTMSGVTYDTAESLAILDGYAPAFPWQTLAKAVNSGQLQDQQWNLQSWNAERMRLEHAGSTVEWIVESSRFTA